MLVDSSVGAQIAFNGGLNHRLEVPLERRRKWQGNNYPSSLLCEG